MEENIKVNLIRTDSVCFITDCDKTGGYYYDHHISQIKNLLFDDEKPAETFAQNWYQINRYPEKIQREIIGERTNERYELKNKDLISEKLPETIPYIDRGNYEREIIDTLYKYTFDVLPNRLEDISLDITVIMEVDNFKPAPLIHYTGIHKWDYKDVPYDITNADVNSQWFDRIIFPEILLPSRPCSFSSKQVYDITRQYVRDHIDGSKAKITSDYDFCFTVKKIVPLIEPETISYQNIFARIKKERSKIRYSTKKFNEFIIFEMTHDQRRYENYTVIKAIYGNNEDDLKSKMDEWLETLISIINKPLDMCPHCNGNGYLDDIKKIRQDEIIQQKSNL